MIAAAHLNPNVWWYLARSSGLVAWGLMAATVAWGLVLAGRLTRSAPPPAWNLDLHRFLGGLSVVFVALHVAGLAADQYVDFGLAQILVPFTSHWRPVAVAWGVTAMYVMIAVEVTSLLRTHLSRRVWRSVHMLSFGLFVLSTLHAIQSGTDVARPIVASVGVALILATVAVGVLRATTLRSAPPSPPGRPARQMERSLRG